MYERRVHDSEPLINQCIGEEVLRNYHYTYPISFIINVLRKKKVTTLVEIRNKKWILKSRVLEKIIMKYAQVC